MERKTVSFAGAIVIAVFTGSATLGMVSGANGADGEKDALRYAVNDSGYSFGQLPGFSDPDFGKLDVEDFPDLISVQATNGVEGYAYREDLFGPGLAQSPAEALVAGNPGEHVIPVYASDGTTVIGKFVVAAKPK